MPALQEKAAAVPNSYVKICLQREGFVIMEGSTFTIILSILAGLFCCVIVPVAAIVIIVVIVMKNKKKKEAEQQQLNNPEYVVNPPEE